MDEFCFKLFFISRAKASGIQPLSSMGLKINWLLIGIDFFLKHFIGLEHFELNSLKN